MNRVGEKTGWKKCRYMDIQYPQGAFDTCITFWPKDNRRRGDLDKTSLPISRFEKQE